MRIGEASDEQYTEVYNCTFQRYYTAFLPFLSFSVYFIFRSVQFHPTRLTSRRCSAALLLLASAELYVTSVNITA